MIEPRVKAMITPYNHTNHASYDILPRDRSLIFLKDVVIQFPAFGLVHVCRHSNACMPYCKSGEDTVGLDPGIAVWIVSDLFVSRMNEDSKLQDPRHPLLSDPQSLNTVCRLYSNMQTFLTDCCYSIPTHPPPKAFPDPPMHAPTHLQSGVDHFENQICHRQTCKHTVCLG